MTKLTRNFKDKNSEEISTKKTIKYPKTFNEIQEEFQQNIEIHTKFTIKNKNNQNLEEI